MMLGRQVGTLLTEFYRLEVTIDKVGDPTYRKMYNGTNEELSGYCSYIDVYDTRQGTMVPGIVLYDVAGHPISGEEFKMNDFTWSGGFTSGHGEVIPFI